MTDVRLKRCPVCDGRPLLTVSPAGKDIEVGIECTRCSCATPRLFYRPVRPGGQAAPTAASLDAARLTASRLWNDRTELMNAAQ